MNMIVERITDALGGLPAWLNQTPTGRKLLSEREEGLKKVEAEAFTDRAQLVAAYQAALKTEAADEELARMITERDNFVAETTPRKNRWSTFRFRDGVTVNRIERMDRAINARRRMHRAPAEELKKKLKAEAPAWLRDAVSTFTANLAALEKQVAGLTARQGEKIGYDNLRGIECVVQVFDYAEYRNAMSGPNGARGWIPRASKQARAMLLEAVTPDEVKARLEAIRRTQPAQKATWRNV